jgi:hypothetical protein
LINLRYFNEAIMLYDKLPEAFPKTEGSMRLGIVVSRSLLIKLVKAPNVAYGADIVLALSFMVKPSESLCVAILLTQPRRKSSRRNQK